MATDTEPSLDWGTFLKAASNLYGSPQQSPARTSADDTLSSLFRDIIDKYANQFATVEPQPPVGGDRSGGTVADMFARPTDASGVYPTAAQGQQTPPPVAASAPFSGRDTFVPLVSASASPAEYATVEPQIPVADQTPAAPSQPDQTALPTGGGVDGTSASPAAAEKEYATVVPQPDPNADSGDVKALLAEAEAKAAAGNAAPTKTQAQQDMEEADALVKQVFAMVGDQNKDIKARLLKIADADLSPVQKIGLGVIAMHNPELAMQALQQEKSRKQNALVSLEQLGSAEGAQRAGIAEHALTAVEEQRRQRQEVVKTQIAKREESFNKILNNKYVSPDGKAKILVLRSKVGDPSYWPVIDDTIAKSLTEAAVGEQGDLKSKDRLQIINDAYKNHIPGSVVNKEMTNLGFAPLDAGTIADMDAKSSLNQTQTTVNIGLASAQTGQAVANTNQTNTLLSDKQNQVQTESVSPLYTDLTNTQAQERANLAQITDINSRITKLSILRDGTSDAARKQAAQNEITSLQGQLSQIGESSRVNRAKINNLSARINQLTGAKTLPETTNNVPEAVDKIVPTTLSSFAINKLGTNDIGAALDYIEDNFNSPEVVNLGASMCRSLYATVPQSDRESACRALVSDLTAKMRDRWASKTHWPFSSMDAPSADSIYMQSVTGNGK